MPGLVFDPIVPIPLIALGWAALAVFTVWQYLKVGAHLSRGRNLCLLFLRVAGLAFVLLLLLQPSRRELIPPPARDRVTLVGVDTSLSMKQTDAGRASRLDGAKGLLQEAGIINNAGGVAEARTRLYEFSAEATPVTGSALDLRPKGTTTRLHTSVTTMFNSLGEKESARALVLLSDGHDFELASPAKTGLAARQRQTPIYAVPLGRQGRVRDVSARITSFQPYIYVRQKARITATLRLIGCEFEDLQVQLLRHNQVAQTRRVNAAELTEVPVEFEVTEAQTGQFEYEIRVQPLEGEVDAGNNSAITYLNVIDQQIAVLVLEGAPYWDTTFLQRSLMRNDKFAVDTLVKYGEQHVRAIRKDADMNRAELKLPESAAEFARYDVVILGRNVHQLLSRAQIAHLTEYARERGGTVIFSRGPAFGGTAAGNGNELEPVLWGEAAADRVKLQVAREGQASSPFRALGGEGAGVEALPEMLTRRAATGQKPLTATLANATSADGSATQAMVHRRFGSGQVVSIGVEGLWRWGFHANSENVNSAFDRFWDQLILWLLASRDFVPARQFSFRTSGANVPLGEKVYFRLMMRTPDRTVKRVPLRLLLGSAEVARLNLAASPGDPARLVADFLPERTGRYSAVATFPDGSTQESRFIVSTENLEETEVATDVNGLRRLCEASGGRLLAPDELGKLVRQLSAETVNPTPQTRLITVWDRAWVFWALGLLFGAEWYLRRRWGLS
jgi:hypothetical protein